MTDDNLPDDPETTLDPREGLFAALVIENPLRSYSESARLAGYAPGSAHVAASRLLKRDKVRMTIERAIGRAIDRSQINAEWILLQAAEMVTADIADILTDEGALRPVREWPLIWRQMCSGVEIKEIEEHLDNGISVKVGELKKAKFVDKHKALETAGKVVGAFQETVRHDHRHLHAHARLDDDSFRKARRAMLDADDC